MRRPSLRANLASLPPDRLLLFLDFDGTLTPIVSRPDRVRLKASVRGLLRRLAKAMPIVIVSGRALSELQRLVGVPALRYVASHGLVYREPGAKVRWFGRPASRRHVRGWVLALERAAKGIAGALVEDKESSVALHDRSVRPADRRTLRRRALRALEPWLAGRQAALIHGKRVLEVRPAASWNKGTAVARLLNEPWARGRSPVYFGDDRTDFDAFRVLRGRGLSVRVGGRRSVAGEAAWLNSPEAVESLLRWLLAQVEAGERPPRENRPIRRE